MLLVPAFIQLFGFWTFPESPRFLIKQGKEQKARSNLNLIRNGRLRSSQSRESETTLNNSNGMENLPQDEVDQEFEEMKFAIESETNSEIKGVSGMVEIFKTASTRRALFIGFYHVGNEFYHFFVFCLFII